MREDILKRKNDILRWIDEERPKSYISKELHCKQETLNLYLRKMGIEYAGQQNKPGQAKSERISALEYLKRPSIKSHVLKRKLIEDGIKKCECEICQSYMWQGVPLPLELHHKDGNHYNNELDNLQILCPNCHSIQEGNSGSNMGKYTKNDKRSAPKQKSIKSTKPSSQKRENTYCIKCGKKLSGKGKTGLCAKCSRESQRVVERPSRDELKHLIRTQSFLSIGYKYGVSDKAIEKWCVAVNLPHKSREIKRMTDIEWEAI